MEALWDYEKLPGRTLLSWQTGDEQCQDSESVDIDGRRYTLKAKFGQNAALHGDSIAIARVAFPGHSLSNQGIILIKTVSKLS